MSVPPNTPVFQPAGLDNLVLLVADPGKAAPYYEKLFGPVASRDPKSNTIRFAVGTSKLALRPLEGGQKSGIERFCVSVAKFDTAAVTKQLTALGAKVAGKQPEGALLFMDPDGIPVEVLG